MGTTVNIPANLLLQVIGTLGQIKSVRGMTVSDIVGLQAQLQACLAPPAQLGPGEVTTNGAVGEDEADKRIADANSRLGRPGSG